MVVLGIMMVLPRITILPGPIMHTRVTVMSMGPFMTGEITALHLNRIGLSTYPFTRAAMAVLRALVTERDEIIAQRISSILVGAQTHSGPYLVLV